MTTADCVAVVSAYRPSAQILDVVRVLVAQCSVIVVDDGSGSEFEPVLQLAESAGATIMRRAENAGIAAALNAGIAHAFAHGAVWAATFDQDSRPAEGHIARSIAAARTAASNGLALGALVPERFAQVRQAYGPVLAPGVRAARRVIQSGMLVPRAAWDLVGPLRDDYFIDLVDTEFELRLRAAGRQVLAVEGLSLPHSLGTSLRLSPFSAPPWDRLGLTTMVSTPFRYYYRVRNRVVLTRSYFFRFPARVLGDAVTDAVYFAVLAVCARPRREFLAIVLRAGVDGLRGRLGPIPGALSARAASVTWNARAA